MILFSIAFSLVGIDLLVSLSYLEFYFSNSISTDVGQYRITSFVTNFAGSAFTESLSIAFDALSLSSFLVMWIATACASRSVSIQNGYGEVSGAHEYPPCLLHIPPAGLLEKCYSLSCFRSQRPLASYTFCYLVLLNRSVRYYLVYHF